MAGKELVSNLPLSGLTTFCRDKNIPTGLNEEMVERAKSYPLLS
jgi:hypothetical protein